MAGTVTIIKAVVAAPARLHFITIFRLIGSPRLRLLLQPPFQRERTAALNVGAGDQNAQGRRDETFVTFFVSFRTPWPTCPPQGYNFENLPILIRPGARSRFSAMIVYYFSERNSVTA
jgi:hypothetical protein